MKNPTIQFPPDYFLYETYRLDHQKFLEDGRVAAAEVCAWTRPYFTSAPQQVLDWGCGVGRIIRHLPELFPDCMIHGCDINTEMVRWNVTHYPGIHFRVSDHRPPTGYTDAKFDLVYGFSVLTHINASLQREWLEELHRIIKRKGILVLTTHGDQYVDQLTRSEENRLRQSGIYTRTYSKKGHRMVTTYHDAHRFRELLAPFFTVLKYYDGQVNIDMIGGQDLWLLQKR